MKQIIIIILLFISLLANSATYHIATDVSGDYQTITQVNAASFNPGDSVLFRRGDTWYGTYLIIPSSGTTSTPIYFGAYGTGAKPRIFASEIPTSWADMTGNIWATPAEFNDPYAGGYEGEVFFELIDSVAWGVHQITKSGLTAEYDWHWSNDSIYVYSTSSPATRYVSVDVSQRSYCILLNDKEHIIFDSLDVRYAQIANIKEVWPYKDLHGLEIKNCFTGYTAIKGSGEGYGIECYHSNSWIHHNTSRDQGRRGMSIYTLDATGGKMHNVIIEHNEILNCYHTGIDIACTQINGRLDSVVVRNNYIYETNTESLEHNGMSHISIIGYDPSATMSRIYVYNNISYNPTSVGILLQRADSVYISNNTIYSSRLRTTTGLIALYLTTNNCEIKNNITYTLHNFDWDANNQHFNIAFEAATIYASNIVDYNLYYQHDSVRVYGAKATSVGGGFYWNNISNDDWDAYKLATGFDANSQYPSDPLFSDTVSADLGTPVFSLNNNSPAIDHAEPISYITTDYFGNARSATTPTIGAVEFTTTPMPTPRVIKNKCHAIISGKPRIKNGKIFIQ